VLNGQPYPPSCLGKITAEEIIAGSNVKLNGWGIMHTENADVVFHFDKKSRTGKLIEIIVNEKCATDFLGIQSGNVESVLERLGYECLGTSHYESGQRTKTVFTDRRALAIVSRFFDGRLNEVSYLRYTPGDVESILNQR
jgi:hypothetical protein